MTKTFALLTLVAAIMLGAASAKAQNLTAAQPATAQPSTPAPDQSGSNLVTLAGCLERGSGADEFALHGQTADSWELKSDSVPLMYFIEEEVIVTATKPQTPEGTYTVTALRIVTPTCSSW
jgi:hypothetical protein